MATIRELLRNMGINPEDIPQANIPQSDIARGAREIAEAEDRRIVAEMERDVIQMLDEFTPEQREDVLRQATEETISNFVGRSINQETLTDVQLRLTQALAVPPEMVLSDEEAGNVRRREAELRQEETQRAAENAVTQGQIMAQAMADQLRRSNTPSIVPGIGLGQNIDPARNTLGVHAVSIPGQSSPSEVTGNSRGRVLYQGPPIHDITVGPGIQLLGSTQPNTVHIQIDTTWLAGQIAAILEACDIPVEEIMRRKLASAANPQATVADLAEVQQPGRRIRLEGEENVTEQPVDNGELQDSQGNAGGSAASATGHPNGPDSGARE